MTFSQPDALRIRTMDVSLILYAEHEFAGMRGLLCSLLPLSYLSADSFHVRLAHDRVDPL